MGSLHGMKLFRVKVISGAFWERILDGKTKEGHASCCHGLQTVLGQLLSELLHGFPLIDPLPLGVSHRFVSGHSDSRLDFSLVLQYTPTVDRMAPGICSLRCSTAKFVNNGSTLTNCLQIDALGLFSPSAFIDSSLLLLGASNQWEKKIQHGWDIFSRLYPKLVRNTSKLMIILQYVAWGVAPWVNNAICEEVLIFICAASTYIQSTQWPHVLERELARGFVSSHYVHTIHTTLELRSCSSEYLTVILKGVVVFFCFESFWTNCFLGSLQTAPVLLLVVWIFTGRSLWSWWVDDDTAFQKLQGGDWGLDLLATWSLPVL